MTKRWWHRHWWSHCTCGHIEFFHLMAPIGPGYAEIRTCLLCTFCTDLVRQDIETVMKRVHPQ